MRYILLFVIVALLQVVPLSAQENAAHYYLEAARMLKNSHTSKPIDNSSIWLLAKKFEAVLEKPIDHASSVSDMLKAFAKKEEAWNLLRKGTETKMCRWNFPTLPDGVLEFFNDAKFLSFTAYLHFVELANQKKYDEAIAAWNDAMKLSRRISLANGIVCNLSGMRSEELGINIMMNYLPHFQDSKIKQIQMYWQELPKRPLSHEAVLADCNFGIIYLKQYSVQAFLELGYKSPTPLGMIGDIKIPLQVGEYMYSLDDWLGAIYCLCAVDFEFIETTIAEYIDCIAVHFTDFDKKYTEFMSRMDSLENSPNKAVLFSLFPASQAMKYAEQRMNTLESDFQQVLMEKQ